MLKDFEKALENKEKSKSAINFDAFTGINRRNTTQEKSSASSTININVFEKKEEKKEEKKKDLADGFINIDLENENDKFKNIDIDAFGKKKNEVKTDVSPTIKINK